MRCVDAYACAMVLWPRCTVSRRFFRSGRERRTGGNAVGVMAMVIAVVVGTEVGVGLGDGGGDVLGDCVGVGIDRSGTPRSSSKCRDTVSRVVEVYWDGEEGR